MVLVLQLYLPYIFHCPRDFILYGKSPHCIKCYGRKINVLLAIALLNDILFGNTSSVDNTVYLYILRGLPCIFPEKLILISEILTSSHKQKNIYEVCKYLLSSYIAMHVKFNSLSPVCFHSVCLMYTSFSGYMS